MSMVPVKARVAKDAHLAGMDEYRKLYAQSINQPEEFWREQAKALTWYHHPHSILDQDV